jgi:hypothetical protein
VLVAFARTSRADTPEPAATGSASESTTGCSGCVVEPAPHVEPTERERPTLSHRGWTVDFSGYVQADAVVYSQASQDEINPSTTEPLNEEHFGIPRASLRADARRGALAGDLELEGFTTRATLPRQTQTSGVRLETAEIRWHRRQLVELVGGLFRTPFGALTPTSPRDRSFLELPTMSRALFPGDSDAGLMARGAFELVRWSIAAMNGAPVADAQWKGRDPASSYDFVARVGADIPLPHRGRFVGGLSALTGTALHPGTPPTKDQLQWIDENQDGIVQTTELTVIPGRAAEPSQTYHHDALGIDLAAHWCLREFGHGVVQLEGAIATNLDRGLVYADKIARSRDIRELGFSLGVVQDLGPYAMAGVRYDRYDADRDANETQGVTTVYVHQVFTTLAVMAAAKLPGARLTVEYDRNTNPLGRDDTGMPTTQRDDRVTIRGQVEF